jgi:hypothetical protein
LILKGGVEIAKASMSPARSQLKHRILWKPLLHSNLYPWSFMSDVSHAVRGSTVFVITFLPVLTRTLFENFQPEKLFKKLAILCLPSYLSDDKFRRIRKAD